MCRTMFVLEKYVWLASLVLDLLVTMAVKCSDRPDRATYNRTVL